MVHNIEYKRFWCGNHVLLKQDKREFLTELLNRYLQQNSLWSQIDDKYITAPQFPFLKTR